MKQISHIVILIAAVVTQITIVDVLSVKGISPDLVLIALCFVALRGDRYELTALGFLAGLLLDSIGPGILGANALAKSIAGFLAVTLFSVKSIHHLYELLGVFAIIALVNSFILHFIIFVGHQSFWALLISKTLPSLVYTIVLFFIFFFFLPVTYWKRYRVGGGIDSGLNY
ncbi:MAG: rod shape-determining protein MreD [Calditrichaeota bacterium]|nr:rod shape-determining protein MreD [Calditrichota bacterium]